MIESVLFDFDGTLVDTSPDLHHAVNHIRETLNLPSLSKETTRPISGNGAKALLAAGNDIAGNHDQLANELFKHYQNNILIDTVIFDGVNHVIEFLDAKQIPWGIVTNRHEYLTYPLIKQLHFYSQPQCVVCGDTLEKAKPHPEPILHALNQLKMPAETCLYIGDHERDIQAGKAANTLTAAALYGYIDDNELTCHWGADFIINHPGEILAILEEKVAL